MKLRGSPKDLRLRGSEWSFPNNGTSLEGPFNEDYIIVGVYMGLSPVDGDCHKTFLAAWARQPGSILTFTVSLGFSRAFPKPFTLNPKPA